MRTSSFFFALERNVPNSSTVVSGVCCKPEALMGFGVGGGQYHSESWSITTMDAAPWITSRCKMLILDAEEGAKALEFATASRAISKVREQFIFVEIAKEEVLLLWTGVSILKFVSVIIVTQQHRDQRGTETRLMEPCRCRVVLDTSTSTDRFSQVVFWRWEIAAWVFRMDF